MICTFCDRFLLVFALSLVTLGCQPAKVETPVEDDLSVTSSDDRQAPGRIADSSPPPNIEVSAEQLLAARLPEAEVTEGWIRLFDGHTLFGWQIAGDANWRVEDGSIVVDQGDACLLCTSVPWQNFELILRYFIGVFHISAFACLLVMISLSFPAAVDHPTPYGKSV